MVWNACGHLHRARRAEHVPVAPFGRTDREPGVITEYRLDGLRFAIVALAAEVPWALDVGNIRFQTAERNATHAARKHPSPPGAGDEVIRVRCVAVTDNLTINLRAALFA